MFVKVTFIKLEEIRCGNMYFKNEFTDYLISIAPSEETVLFVKQIPKADLFHKDGAQQCAWPGRASRGRVD